MGEWETVNRRRGRPSSTTAKDRRPEATSFFVTNIPEGCTASLLWKVFGDFGKIVDSYVARKKDARGNNFGFVRFQGIRDGRSMLESLNTIKIEGAKLSVSLAKYGKDNQRLQHSHTPPNKQPRGVFDNMGYVEMNSRYVKGNNMSFKEALISHNPPKPAIVVPIHDNSAWFPESTRRRALICEAFNLYSLVNARKVLEGEGLYNMKLCYIGGLYSILSFDSTYEAKQFITNSEPSWKSVFKNVVLWEGQDIPSDRIACLTITGVPILIRDENTYNRIGEKFGQVLIPSDFSWDEKDASSGKIHVLVKNGLKINEEILVEWRNKQHRVWVTEEEVDLWPSIDDSTSNEAEDDDDDLPTINSEADDMPPELNDREPKSPEEGNSNSIEVEETPREAQSSTSVNETPRSVIDARHEDIGTHKSKDLENTGGANDVLSGPIIDARHEDVGTHKSKDLENTGGANDVLSGPITDVHLVGQGMMPEPNLNYKVHDSLLGQEKSPLGLEEPLGHHQDDDANYNNTWPDLNYQNADDLLDLNESLPDSDYWEEEAPISLPIPRRAKKADRHRRRTIIRTQERIMKGGGKSAIWASISKSQASSSRYVSKSISVNSHHSSKSISAVRETQNTKEIGELMGYNMNGFESNIHEMVKGVGVENSFQ